MNMLDLDLSNIAFFKAMDAKSQEIVLAKAQLRDFDIGQTIFEQDDEANFVFFTLSGRVRQRSLSPSGQEVHFFDLGPYSLFGHDSAIDGKRHANSAISLFATQTLMWSRQTFVELFRTHGLFAFEVAKIMAQTVREGHERIMDLGTLAASNRVYAELFRLVEEIIPDEKGRYVLNPAPPASDISHHACTTRETVSRVISHLTTIGILERHDHSLIIRDLPRLKDMIENAKNGDRRSNLDKPAFKPVVYQGPNRRRT